MSLEMMKCERRSMTLSRSGCATLYKSTLKSRGTAFQVKPWEGRSACVQCPIGAACAGLTLEKTEIASPVGARWCLRHEGMAERVIHGRLCVSCYNREREAVGPAASARVKAKQGIRDLAAKLSRRQVSFCQDGVLRHVLSPLVCDTREAIESVAMQAPGTLAIGRLPIALPPLDCRSDYGSSVLFGRSWLRIPGVPQQMRFGIAFNLSPRPARPPVRPSIQPPIAQIEMSL